MTPRKEKIDTATDYFKVVQLAATGLGLMTGAASLIEARRQRSEAAEKKASVAKEQIIDLPQSKAYEA
jgi:hypothetical protein